MVQQMASVAVIVDAHIFFQGRQGPAACDALNEGAKLFGENGVADLHQVLQAVLFGVGETVQIGQVARLVDLVNVRFFIRKPELLDNFVPRGT